MEGIKQWAFAICAAMVACGIAQMLLPKDSMEKVFRVTVSVFFLCCLLSPVVLQNPGLRIELEETTQEDIAGRAERLTNAALSQAQGAAGKELEKIIGEKLTQMGINYHRITINLNINGQSEADVTQVDILLDGAHAGDHERIMSSLSDQLGLSVHLAYDHSGDGGTGEED